MIAALEHLVRPLLHALDPEDAHALTLKLLKIAAALPVVRDDPRFAEETAQRRLRPFPGETLDSPRTS